MAASAALWHHEMVLTVGAGVHWKTGDVQALSRVPLNASNLKTVIIIQKTTQNIPKMACIISNSIASLKENKIHIKKNSRHSLQKAIEIPQYFVPLTSNCFKVVEFTT